MTLEVSDLEVGQYVHDETHLYRVVDAEKLISGRMLVRLENASASFVADDSEPFYDTRLFTQEDVEKMDLVAPYEDAL